ncbi:MAG: CDP-diacylglycerol--glycerol-3-phosphate 3-phosphatidyltransferase [Bdellovibrionaceae bacterium]|nr:CDP-diacylglycerol--glycerol-3-phosphate 3-phosphatidyltransferase [Bdellovibrio sp.]
MSRIPLYLTTSRILLVLPTAAFLYVQSPWGRWAAAFCFIVASITDYYDGYYARKLNAVSNLGKFLDPVADKILVSSVLIILLQKAEIDPWMVILFVARDTIVGGVRAAAAADGVVLSAQTTGKWKAALQMIAIPMLIVNDLHPNLPLNKFGYGLLWLSVLLSLKSGFDYCASYHQAKKGLFS